MVICKIIDFSLGKSQGEQSNFVKPAQKLHKGYKMLVTLCHRLQLDSFGIMLTVVAKGNTQLNKRVQSETIKNLVIIRGCQDKGEIFLIPKKKEKVLWLRRKPCL